MSETRKASNPVNHSVNALVISILLGSAFLSQPLFAQVLVVKPVCGVAGSTVNITGSGWAEPSPVCHYNFLFDGTPFAPPQPDGLFGPPNRVATIPAGAATGDHKIQVELRLDSDNFLLQCRQTTFKVVAIANKDPWANNVAVNPPAFGAGVITAEFDHTDVCDLTPCTDIRLIQVIQHTGEKADGTGTRLLTYGEQGFPDPDPSTPEHEQQQDKTPAGWVVDTLWGKPNPYYPFPIPDKSVSGSNQGAAPQPTATLGDGPSRPSAAAYYDSLGLTSIVLNFEINAFCAAGPDKGEFLGQVKWKWEQPKGGTPTATLQSATRNAPSQEFRDAVAKWDANSKHDPFNLPIPTQTPPTAGGEACN